MKETIRAAMAEAKRQLGEERDARVAAQRLERQRLIVEREVKKANKEAERMAGQ